MLFTFKINCDPLIPALILIALSQPLDLFAFSMPSLTIPSFSLMKDVISQSLVISIVAFAVNVSLVKSFAKKNKYEIDSNQVCSYSNGIMNHSFLEDHNLIS